MSSRMYNLLVTNVPGPQFSVYALGRRLSEVIPVPFLAPDHALAIAIMSYDGGINFGLLGDYDQLDDIDVVRDAIAEELDNLLALARRAAPREEPELAATPASHNGRPVAANGRSPRPRRTARKTSPRPRG